MMDKRCLNIISHYGPLHQKRIFAGEYQELQDAIMEVELREQDYINDYQEDMLIDEIADNLVMLGQFIQYYNLPMDKINSRIDYKLDRQERRMENDSKAHERFYPQIQR